MAAVARSKMPKGKPLAGSIAGFFVALGFIVGTLSPAASEHTAFTAPSETFAQFANADKNLQKFANAPLPEKTFADILAATSAQDFEYARNTTIDPVWANATDPALRQLPAEELRTYLQDHYDRASQTFEFQTQYPSIDKLAARVLVHQALHHAYTHYVLSDFANGEQSFFTNGTLRPGWSIQGVTPIPADSLPDSHITQLRTTTLVDTLKGGSSGASIASIRPLYEHDFLARTNHTELQTFYINTANNNGGGPITVTLTGNDNVITESVNPADPVNDPNFFVWVSKAWQNLKPNDYVLTASIGASTMSYKFRVFPIPLNIQRLGETLSGNSYSYDNPPASIGLPYDAAPRGTIYRYALGFNITLDYKLLSLPEPLATAISDAQDGKDIAENYDAELKADMKGADSVLDNLYCMEEFIVSATLNLSFTSVGRGDDSWTDAASGDATLNLFGQKVGGAIELAGTQEYRGPPTPESGWFPHDYHVKGTLHAQLTCTLSDIILGLIPEFGPIISIINRHLGVWNLDATVEIVSSLDMELAAKGAHVMGRVYTHGFDFESSSTLDVNNTDGIEAPVKESVFSMFTDWRAGMHASVDLTGGASGGLKATYADDGNLTDMTGHLHLCDPSCILSWTQEEHLGPWSWHQNIFQASLDRVGAQCTLASCTEEGPAFHVGGSSMMHPMMSPVAPSGPGPQYVLFSKDALPRDYNQVAKPPLMFNQTAPEHTTVDLTATSTGVVGVFDVEHVSATDYATIQNAGATYSCTANATTDCVSYEGNVSKQSLANVSSTVYGMEDVARVRNNDTLWAKDQDPRYKGYMLHDSHLDQEPRIAYANQSVEGIFAWERNTANLTAGASLLNASGSSRIYFQWYNGTAWSKPAPISDDGHRQVEPRVTISSDGKVAALSWLEDNTTSWIDDVRSPMVAFLSRGHPMPARALGPINSYQEAPVVQFASDNAALAAYVPITDSGNRSLSLREIVVNDTNHPGHTHLMGEYPVDAQNCAAIASTPRMVSDSAGVALTWVENNADSSRLVQRSLGKASAIVTQMQSNPTALVLGSEQVVLSKEGIYGTKFQDLHFITDGQSLRTWVWVDPVQHSFMAMHDKGALPLPVKQGSLQAQTPGQVCGPDQQVSNPAYADAAERHLMGEDATPRVPQVPLVGVSMLQAPAPKPLSTLVQLQSPFQPYALIDLRGTKWEHDQLTTVAAATWNGTMYYLGSGGLPGHQMEVFGGQEFIAPDLKTSIQIVNVTRVMIPPYWTPDGHTPVPPSCTYADAYTFAEQHCPARPGPVASPGLESNYQDYLNVTVNATIYNDGLKDSAGATLKLWIDGAVVKTVHVAPLPVGAFTWTGNVKRNETADPFGHVFNATIQRDAPKERDMNLTNDNSTVNVGASLLVGGFASVGNDGLDVSGSVMNVGPIVYRGGNATVTGDDGTVLGRVRVNPINDWVAPWCVLPSGYGPCTTVYPANYTHPTPWGAPIYPRTSPWPMGNGPLSTQFDGMVRSPIFHKGVNILTIGLPVKDEMYLPNNYVQVRFGAYANLTLAATIDSASRTVTATVTNAGGIMSAPTNVTLVNAAGTVRNSASVGALAVNASVTVTLSYPPPDIGTVLTAQVNADRSQPESRYSDDQVDLQG